MIPPTGSLRAISLTVDEPESGAFRWLLLESRVPGEWVELSSATLSHMTYALAVADGLVALQALADDLDVGPRNASEHITMGRAPGRFFGSGPV